MVSNAEGSIDGILGTTYCTMDALCFARDASEIVGSAAEIAKASSVAAAAFISIPFLYFFTGILYLATSINGLREAGEAKKTAEVVLKRLKMKEGAKKVDVPAKDLPVSTKGIERAEKRVELAGAGIVSWQLYFTLGLLQLGTMAVMAMSSESVTRLLGYAPVWTGHLAKEMLHFLLIGSGVFFVVRGSWMLRRAYNTYHFLHQIRREFRQTFEETVKEVVNAPRYQKIDVEGIKGKVKQFLDDAAALLPEVHKKEHKLFGKKKTARNEVDVDLYTGLSIDDVKTKRELITYLNDLDKELYTAILGEKIAGAIGSVMIIGGFLHFAAAALSWGSTALITEIVSASLFMAMESVFFLYDSSSALSWVHNYRYNTKFSENKSRNWIQDLIDLSPSKQDWSPHHMKHHYVNIHKESLRLWREVHG
jgi:hypothetical protein